MPLALLLAGGTAGGAWLARHLAAAVLALGALFLASLWLLLRPDPEGGSRVVGE